MAAKKKTAKGYELLVAELKKNKNAVYADLAAKAEKKGFTVYPVLSDNYICALTTIRPVHPGTPG